MLCTLALLKNSASGFLMQRKWSTMIHNGCILIFHVHRDNYFQLHWHFHYLSCYHQLSFHLCQMVLIRSLGIYFICKPILGLLISWLSSINWHKQGFCCHHCSIFAAKFCHWKMTKQRKSSQQRKRSFNAQLSFYCGIEQEKHPLTPPQYPVDASS